MNDIERGIAEARLAADCDENGILSGRYLFRETFAGFGGHFPGYPILPAIVEIRTVVSLVAELTGRRQRLAAVEEAKFLKPVRPDQELQVRCRQRTVKGKELHDATLSVGDEITATLLLQLIPEGVTA